MFDLRSRVPGSSDKFCLQVTQRGRKWYLWVSSICSQCTQCSGMEFCSCTSIMLRNLATQQGFGLNSHLQAGINVHNGCSCASGSPSFPKMIQLISTEAWCEIFKNGLIIMCWETCKEASVQRENCKKESDWKWNSLTSNRHCEQAAQPCQARKQGLN